MNKQPLISCICVTRGKPGQLAKAIACFEAQTWPEKELVLLCEDDDRDTLLWLQTQQMQKYYRLLVVPANPKQSLGQLRNKAIRKAWGDYICQWDDDDWYHCDRLKIQYESMLQAGKNASVLSRWLLYDSGTEHAYLSHRRMWEGSLLCKKELLLQYPYTSVARGEDTPVIDALYKTGHIHLLNTAPQLYVYNWHGANTWHRQHWESLFCHGTQLENDVEKTVQHIMQSYANIREQSALLDHLITRKPIISYESNTPDNPSYVP